MVLGFGGAIFVLNVGCFVSVILLTDFSTLFT